MIELRHSAWEAKLTPQIGGSIATLSWRGADILRPGRASEHNPLALGCFPLLPYVNRIARGRFVWQGEVHQLRCDRDDSRWSLHGLGWHRPWEVADQGIDAARLTLDHAPDADWPWPFHAEQAFALSTKGLLAVLSLTNHAEGAVPVGLGFHPYFQSGPQTRLTTQVAAAWGADTAILPTTRLAPDAFGDWAAGDRVAQLQLVDNGYEGWAGRAVIDHGDFRVVLQAPEARFFHLYIPPASRFFVAEPVTHLPNVINRPDMPPMPVLAPGETARLTMTISAEVD